MATRKKWVKHVKTDSTHPRAGLFKKDAATIAREMGSKRVSPKGIGSGIRMIQYFLNRGGKGLSATRRKEPEKAKHILQEKQHHFAARSGDRQRAASRTKRTSHA
jgi:tRNA(adenine34) deaminase